MVYPQSFRSIVLTCEDLSSSTSPRSACRCSLLLFSVGQDPFTCFPSGVCSLDEDSHFFIVFLMSVMGLILFWSMSPMPFTSDTHTCEWCIHVSPILVSFVGSSQSNPRLFDALVSFSKHSVSSLPFSVRFLNFHSFFGPKWQNIVIVLSIAFLHSSVMLLHST